MTEVLLDSPFGNWVPMRRALETRRTTEIAAVDVSLYPVPVPQLHGRAYTTPAWSKYEHIGHWFFLLQCFEAMFYLCDRMGFKPEQVAYVGVIGRGAKACHLWTAMAWKL